MLVGLFLRHVLRQKLILLFTSAAQREHTWLTKFCYRRMDSVIATTENAARFLQCESTVSHHGVDTTTFKPPADRQAVRRTLQLDDRPTLGVFGRVRPQKGTGDLVEALLQTLPKHPQWQVVLIGAITEAYIPYQNELAQNLQAAGLADRVHFQGFLEDFAQLPMWYQAVDVVGCFSRNEGFGVTCLEGMASGVPVAATRAGAWPDILNEGKDGWIAEAGNPDDIARALNEMFSKTPEQLQHLGRTAKQTVLDRFTIEHEANRITSVYRDLFQRYKQPLALLSAESSAIKNAA
jgi:mannosyltransferase